MYRHLDLGREPVTIALTTWALRSDNYLKLLITLVSLPTGVRFFVLL